MAFLYVCEECKKKYTDARCGLTGKKCPKCAKGRLLKLANLGD